MSRGQADEISVALKWAGLALLGYLVYLIIEPFLIPLGWACVLAVIAYPTYHRLTRIWGRATAAAFTTLAVTLILIVPALLVTIAFVREAAELGTAVQNALGQGRLAWIERAWAALVRRVPAASNIDVGAMTTDTLRSSVAFLMTQSGSLFRNIAGFVIDLVLALFATFFLLRDADTIMAAVRRLLPMEEDAREELIGRARDLISAGVISSGVVAGVQGLLGGVAFAIVGIEAPVFWGVIIAFFCVLPFGAWVVWLPAAALLAIGGAITRAIVLAVVGLGIISMVDNVLRPMLLSGHARMNGLVIFVSLLGGLSVFGLLGLVLGPILVVTALALLTTHINRQGSGSRDP
jgi:predicted PurR-regulated permease PerM